jgi:hypothetical protein
MSPDTIYADLLHRDKTFCLPERGGRLIICALRMNRSRFGTLAKTVLNPLSGLVPPRTGRAERIVGAAEPRTYQ